MATPNTRTRAKAAKAPEGPTLHQLPVGDLTINFTEPNEGQVIALRKAGLLFKSSDAATQNRGGLLYMDVLDALVHTPEELDEIYQGLADKSLDLEKYADAALTLIQKVAKETQENAAPKTGPVSTRRARAR